MKSKRLRRRIYGRASAIAREIRTADFPEAVDIGARLIAARVCQKAKAARDRRLETQP